MKEAIRKEILYDLQRALTILKDREAKDIEELKLVSDHAIEDVAVQKDLELVSITVLLYSLYKIVPSISDKDYKDIWNELHTTYHALKTYKLGQYNSSVKRLFEIVKRSNAKVQEHLQDVMQAARIKKGASLLQRGLSIGQAAGIMGLSNWDLQQYAGKTMVLAQHDEKYPAEKRLQQALKLFGVSP
ncbi:MAG: hypothetical protein AABX13_02060 [Nanoarchaeota archaeon]